MGDFTELSLLTIYVFPLSPMQSEKQQVRSDARRLCLVKGSG